MITESLKSLYTRDLNKLKTEIQAYKNEETLWIIENSISNSAGNLCLHLVGNLSHFFGAVLGNSEYIRQRELEFSLKDVPRAELLEKVDETLNVVIKTLDQLNKEDLEKEYPIEPLGYKMTTEYFLIHLIGHLEYHLGQINYHRRLLDVE